MTQLNRLLYAVDCLDVLNDPEKLPDKSVGLIYLDPPFNSNSAYNLPFKSRDRSLKPVEAFEDTWRWGAEDDGKLLDLERNPRTRALATVVKFAQEVEGIRRRRSASLAAYLLNMAQRLYAMKRVLKDTGSIYLHCDPTASHYLKLVMDCIYGKENLQNECIWYYKNASRGKRRLARSHDVIFWYSKHVNSYTFNLQDILAPFESGMTEWRYAKGGQTGKEMPKGKTPDDVITMPSLNAMAKERLGYPTQKPLALLERIVLTSSNPGDIVLDPFCGCGTTAHAAEKLGRKWIGVDISKFSTGLIRRRILDNFRYLNIDDIFVLGTPESIADARALAQRDKFEFEKWVCGAMGANGMYKNPGEKGVDGGVDGVVELPVIRQVGSKYESQDEYVIVQVKGGNVTPDAVKALSETVRRLGAVAGIMVCFDDQMGTVENQRDKSLWSDAYKQYPYIQGFSIKDLLAGEKPDMPPTYGYRHGGKTSAPQFL
ncbi:MAG: site-specific DNA-methyltransferase [Chloroflexi bacterium]|nr:site-specific DNA-methyltransferase [Chloroflexota bacterium]MCY4248774.1 site-specific DNA-methyltransferase [Chloroflexota bacterium]